ncbi:hypothetical protein EV383_1432 [Pseudonocardia sediminis]|uniref:Uncharacterized protein n=1 Tax=Pseudonocardia sediminis TaxID=1397368 RepID=A0A4Q7USB7_PSEST|nr:hypothetical protein [Pseudonocardia sediminis]RZT84585.1 hypothetical protein EV383_1432 [Pseudonocardia sediminis]
MNRTTARLVLTVAGAGALSGLAAGAAHADTPADETDSAPALEQETSGVNQTYLLKDAPGVPIEDPTFGVFDVLAPAYGVVGSFS